MSLSEVNALKKSNQTLGGKTKSRSNIVQLCRETSYIVINLTSMTIYIMLFGLLLLMSPTCSHELPALCGQKNHTKTTLMYQESDPFGSPQASFPGGVT